MINKMIFLIIAAVGLLTAAADASMMQEGNDSYAMNSPYPYILSQPLDNLPEGFCTLGTIGMGREIYYYSNGAFYQKLNLLQQYIVVPPPIGAIVDTIPQGYQLMLIDGRTLYEDQGIYYRRVLEGYKVIFPPQ